MFGKGCQINHLDMQPAGVKDEKTWACPYCHLVFKKQKPLKRSTKKHGSYPDATH